MAGHFSAADLQTRLGELDLALSAGGGRLDGTAVKRAREMIDRAADRLSVGADLTVVALVGATGSGKSSLFNALAGLEIAEVGVRRPTTGQATACVWSGGGAEGLLDWIGVPAQLRTNRETVLDADQQSDLHGLVLLDLPDHDSTSVAHRLEVNRLVELVDLMVWVVDPQKYADEALHSGYLRRLQAHEDVMLVVLNQLDRLSPAEAQTCATDLRRLLDSDGLTRVRMLTTSARTGAGVDQVRAVLSELVLGGGAFAGRAMADLDRVGDDLLAHVAAHEPEPKALPGSAELVRALAQSAGVSVIVDAVGADYRHQGAERTGWPPLRWWRQVRPDPLSRLGLDQQTEARIRLAATVESLDTAPVQRAQVELAVRAVASETGASLPQAWSDAVKAAAISPDAALSDALDLAVSSVPLVERRPTWWSLMAVAQYLSVAATLAGLIWWPVALILGSAGPAPAGLLVGGLLLGGLLSGLAHWSVQVGSRHRQDRISGALMTAVQTVATEQVLAPIAAVVGDHRTVRTSLQRQR